MWTRRHALEEVAGRVGGAVKVLLGFLAIWTVPASSDIEAEPVVWRVSFAERGDSRGYVIRVHSTERIAEEDYEVDLIGTRTLLVVLSEARLSRAFRKDAPIGAVADYTALQRRQRVEIRFELRQDLPVHVVFYPDRSSTDFLLALNHAPRASSVARKVRESPSETRTVRGSTNDRPEPAGGEAAGLTSSAPVRSDPGAQAKAEPEGTAAGSAPAVASAAVGERGRSDTAELPAAQRLTPPSLPTDRRDIRRTGAPWMLDCIVIDAGHGGKDSGTMANGLREKDVTLAIALKLGRLIEERLGVRVVYTRTDDRFIELAQRGKIANEAGGKLFVSIHVDAIGGARGKTVQGTSTYFLGLHKTDSARDVMERENSVIKFESNPERYASYRDDDLIMMALAQSAYLQKSEQLSALIEDRFRSGSGRQSRGVKQAGFYVLWSASMPAVLIETGFATHPDEARYLNSERGKDQVAAAIFEAIRTFKAEYERDLGIVQQTGE